jgi:myo-inositol-1-phosphate synthase
MTDSKKVRVAIVGVGNCASSLVQGIQFYQNANDKDQIPGMSTWVVITFGILNLLQHLM